MFKNNFTNADIPHLDWAKRDRAALLRSLNSRKLPRPQRAASSGWNTDVAGSDRRSVHAFLSGKGDLRAGWWNLFSAVYLRLVPGATIERAMFAFHSFHHALTLGRLGFVLAVQRTATDIERGGVVAAARSAVVREFRR